ncbi:hypothetical protein EW146_g5135 [Bondarzewia mesenterica]|uniref:4-dimethylallyltryptophan N-methyltransferase n=1 Tax=Bondarzewia mesenterica TaxID=1095465 RepID=A0A4S4LTE8_9AGAM|nr:hypothetical protein EW146_g5135 [Bondarzewia mesenterica]
MTITQTQTILAEPKIIHARARTSADNGSSYAESKDDLDLRPKILAGLCQPPHQRTIPGLVMYDEEGLRLYDDLTTHAKDYYPFACEEEILKNEAEISIVPAMCKSPINSPEVFIELGSGSMRKTSHLLRALSKAVSKSGISYDHPLVTYYALDVESREINRALTEIQTQMGHELAGKVDARGMLGTYDDGFAFVKEGQLEKRHAISGPTTPRHFVFLGSSLGNFTRNEAAQFLSSLPLRPGSSDSLLLGLDQNSDVDLLRKAYDDAEGYNRKFCINGLKVAGRILGDEDLFDVKNRNWDCIKRFDAEKKFHEVLYQSRTDQIVEVPGENTQLSFVKDETMHVCYSYKYDDQDAAKLFNEANLRPIQRWSDVRGLYAMWLLRRPDSLGDKMAQVASM